MHFSIKELSEHGYAILQNLAVRRLKTNNPALHREVEHNVIARELNDLAAGWRCHPTPVETNDHRRNER